MTEDEGTGGRRGPPLHGVGGAGTNGGVRCGRLAAGRSPPPTRCGRFAGSNGVVPCGSLAAGLGGFLPLPLGEAAERSEDGESQCERQPAKKTARPSQSPAVTALPEGEPRACSRCTGGRHRTCSRRESQGRPRWRGPLHLLPKRGAKGLRPAASSVDRKNGAYRCRYAPFSVLGRPLKGQRALFVWGGDAPAWGLGDVRRCRRRPPLPGTG